MFENTVIRPLAARRSDSEAGISLSKRRTWYAEPTGGDTGDDPADTGNAPKEPADKPTTITYTPEQQAHIDKLTAEQRKQGRQAGQTELLKKLGVEKPEDIEARLKKLADLEKSQMTEAEQRQAELDAEKAKRTEAEQKLTDLLAKQTLDARNSAVKAAAQAGGMTKPDMAMSWLRDNAASDLDALKAGDDGKYDEKAVKALVEKVRKELPELFKPTSPGSPSLRGGHVVTGKPKDIGSTFKL